MSQTQDCIVALATPQGSGALGIIRLSGEGVFDIVSHWFHPANKKRSTPLPHKTAVFGKIMCEDTLVDEVLLTAFHGPQSFTGEDSVEISCHGSPFIIKTVLQLCLQHGARMAEKGEFTLRAYLNGKMDLSEAEAVADVIAADNAAAHQLAISQMKGSISKEIGGLRAELVKLASLLELELDFSEEDVEFADRSQLQQLSQEIVATCTRLTQSFSLGNAIKKGVPLAIVGAPNAGKSTLLNALLKENRAIVSDIEGTTRDSIEEELNIGGIAFRVIDTAGIRETQDEIENLGIARTFEKVQQAAIVLWLVDMSQPPTEDTYTAQKAQLQEHLTEQQKLFVIGNKSDKAQGNPPAYLRTDAQIAAKAGTALDQLESLLTEHIKSLGWDEGVTLISSARHQDALQKTKEALARMLEGMEMGIPSDLLAQDLRQALHFLGEITGEISSDEILGSIFSQFCIGK